MKIFIRLFTSILSLILISFAVFGTLLFYSSFQVLLNRELEANENKTKMIAFALLSSVESVESQYIPEQEDYLSIMNNLAANFSGQRGGFGLYNAQKNAVFEKGIGKEVIGFPEDTRSFDEQTAIQKVITIDEMHYVISFAMVSLQEERYILAVAEDVEYLYDYRKQMYRQYLFITCAVSLLAGLISFGLAYHFAKPVSELSKAALSIADGNYDKRIRISGKDEITDLMKAFNFMAKRTEESVNELEEAARRQEEFTGAFAHELKTPLTSIIGYSDMLQTMELSEEEQLLSANHIYRQGKRLERLSHSMLALCSINNGSLYPENVSAVHIINEAVAMAEFSLKKAHIQLRLEVSEGELFGEKDLLVTLVGNLIDNSRKACDKNNGIIYVEGFTEGDVYVIKVTDNGCGIPPEDLERVREAFYMVDKSRSRRAGGAGLGLTLCNKIVELHGGTFEIKSKVGKGTAVIVRLPIHKTDEVEDLCE